MKQLAGIHRIPEHPPELEVGDLLLQARHIVPDRDERGVVAFCARKLEELAAVGESGIDGSQRFDDARELFLFLAELLARAWARPRSLGSSSSRVTTASRSDFTSKSKIPPQLGRAIGKIGELVGDEVELLGFHGNFRRRNK